MQFPRSGGHHIPYSLSVLGVGIGLGVISASYGDYLAGTIWLVVGGVLSFGSAVLGLAWLAGRSWGLAYVWILVGCGIGIVCSEPLLAAMQGLTARTQREQLPSIPEFVANENAAGRDAVYPVRPNNYYGGSVGTSFGSRLRVEGTEILPLSGLSLRREVLCFEPQVGMVTYQTDRYGFRNDDAIWDAGQIEVFFVGDSLLRGTCVANGHSFVDKVRRELPASLNMGVNGIGPFVQLGILREYGRIARPRIVIFTLEVESDLRDDLFTEGRSYILRSYLDRDFTQSLAAKSEPISAALDEFIAQAAGVTQDEASQRSTLFDFLRFPSFRERARSFYFQKMRADYESYAKIMSVAAREVSSWGGTLYVLYLPVGRFSDLDNSVVTLLSNLDIPVIDINRELRLRQVVPKAILGSLDNHYSREGHAMVGSIVVDRLQTDHPGIFGRRN